MMQETIPRFPKIWAVGSDFIPDLFKGTVEVTEKIDGSAFAFGIDADGTLVMRSKGRQIDPMVPDKMFKKAVDWVLENEQKIREVLTHGEFVYGEYLNSSCHNVLEYGREPKNNIMVYGMMLGNDKPGYAHNHSQLVEVAEELDLEAVPLLYHGEVQGDKKEFVESFLEKESALGKCNAEGIVIKNYDQLCIIGNNVFPSFGKVVTEKFKEVHSEGWSLKFKSASKIENFLWSFHSEARWEKAYQHLRDDGRLSNEPRDIPMVIGETKRDLIEEERENIKNKLFEIYCEDILKKSCVGLPEWYKLKLVERYDKTA